MIARIFFILLSVSFLSSCSVERRIKRAEKRINKAIEKFPSLVKTDTFWRIDYDTIPEIKINTVFQKDTNTSGLDSIFFSFKDKLDSLTALQLKSEIRNYVINKPVFADTVTKIIDGITIKLWQGQEGIEMSLRKPPEVTSEKQISYVNNVGKQRYIPDFFYYTTWGFWTMAVITALVLYLRSKFKVTKKQ